MIKIKPKFLLLFLFGVLAMLTANPTVFHAVPAAVGAGHHRCRARQPDADGGRSHGVGHVRRCPARPFLYSVNATVITITRFNDNQVVGTWPWPESLWIELPDGSIVEIFEPEGGRGTNQKGGIIALLVTGFPFDAPVFTKE